MNLPLRQLQNVAPDNYVAGCGGKFGTHDQSNVLKDEMDNCIVDVCSTEGDEENAVSLGQENIRPTSSTANPQSPKKKSSLVATFSRMSPFKARSLSTVAPTTSSAFNPFLSPKMQRSIENPHLKSIERSPRRKLVFDVATTKCTVASSLPPPPSAHQKVTSSSFKNLSGIFEKCKSSREKRCSSSETPNEITSSSFTLETDSDAARVESGGFHLHSNPKKSEPLGEDSTKIQSIQSRSTSADAFLPPTPPMFCQLEPNCSKSSISRNTNEEDEDDDEAESEVEAALCGGETRKATVSRKEKSLGKLCKRFLLTMGDEAKVCPGKIHLEKVALKMKVEKRRIYDIVNVMEALEAMSKTSKSYYRWHGLAQLPQLMHFLQREGTDLKFPEQIGRVQEAMLRLIEVSSVIHKADRSSDLVGKSKERPSRSPSLLNYSMGSQLSRDDSFVPDVEDGLLSSSLSAVIESGDAGGTVIGGGVLDTSLVSSGSGKNSLAQLCRLFLMVLLCSPTTEGGRRVSLDVASTLLIKDPDNHFREPPRRSRCRRLYDIANVLVAMGLIKKDHYLFGTKKIPMFVYCGPEPDESTERGPFHMREFLTRIGLAAICSVDSMTTTSTASTSANAANDASSVKPELESKDGTEEDDEKYRNIFGDAIPQRRKSSASLLLGGTDESADLFRTPKAPVSRRPSESDQNRFGCRNSIAKCGSEESLLTTNHHPFSISLQHQHSFKADDLFYGSGGGGAALMPPLLSVGSSSIPDLTRICRQQEQQFLIQQQQQQQQQQQKTDSTFRQTATSRHQFFSGSSSSSVSALSTTSASSTSAGSSTLSLSAAPTVHVQNLDALNPPPSVYRCLEDLIRKRLHHSSDSNNSVCSSGQTLGNENTLNVDDKENRQPASSRQPKQHNTKRKKLDDQQPPVAGSSNNGGGDMRSMGVPADLNRHYLSADNIVKPQPVNPFASAPTPLFDFSTSASNEFLLRSNAATGLEQNATIPPLPLTVVQPLPASYAALLQTNLLNSISASLRDLNALIQSSSVAANASSIATGNRSTLLAPYFVLPQTSLAQPTSEVQTMATTAQCMGDHHGSIGGGRGVMHSVLSILGGGVTLPQQQSGAFSVPSLYNGSTPINSSSPKAFKPVSSTRRMS